MISQGLVLLWLVVFVSKTDGARLKSAKQILIATKSLDKKTTATAFTHKQQNQHRIEIEELLDNVLTEAVTVDEEFKNAALPLITYLRNISISRILSRNPNAIPVLTKKPTKIKTALMPELTLKALSPVIRLFIKEIPELVRTRNKTTVQKNIRRDPSCFVCLFDTWQNCYICIVLEGSCDMDLYECIIMYPHTTRDPFR